MRHGIRSISRLDDPEGEDEALEGAQRVSVSTDARHHDCAQDLRWRFAIPSCLENHGTFDFSIIDKVLASLPPGVRFAFTIMIFDPSRVDADLPGCHLSNVIPDAETSQHGFRLPFDPDLTPGYLFPIGTIRSFCDA